MSTFPRHNRDAYIMADDYYSHYVHRTDFCLCRLSKREKNEMITLFGEEYRRYTEKTPMFIPELGGKHNGKDYIKC